MLHKWDDKWISGSKFYGRGCLNRNSTDDSGAVLDTT